MADRKAFDPTKAHAFLSYTRDDDEYLEGGITWLRGALERAVRAQTGSPFQIFQDVEDIEHGDDWELKLAKALESAQLFIPILTPSFFTSEFCRREANSFLDYEAKAGRKDLILPIYLINADVLEDADARADDELATRLHQRQYDDWRELRFALRDRATRPKIEELAGTLARAVKRRVKARAKPPTPEPKIEPQEPSLEGRLSMLETRIAARDQAIEVERSRREQVEAELADERAKTRELVEAPAAFKGQIEEAQKREHALNSEIQGLKEQLAQTGLASVEKRLAGAEAALDEERVRSEKLQRTSLMLPRPWLVGGVALGMLVAVGSWMAEIPQPPSPSDTFKDCEDCPEMVVLPAGTFVMGSPKDEHGRFSSEGPQHEVSIQPFAICTHEVTFDQWDACAAAGGCDHRPKDSGWGRGNQPVINVSLSDAQQYLDWLSVETGRAYRLPSEAEWEYAARAGTKTSFFWGDKIGKANANCRECGSGWDGKQTAPVGSFGANSFGLFDMHGNVREWVKDRWNGSYEGAPDDGTPWLGGGGPARVARSGSWSSTARGVRSAYRHWYEPVYRGDDLGFRCAGDLEPAGG